MSTMDYKLNKLDRNKARKKLATIMNSTSNPIFSRHALQELANDDLTTVDAVNVLKSNDAKIVDEGEFENGSYRYRVETAYIMVVIAFNEEGNRIIVITAWDKRIKS